jgi:hypothetical protein
LAPIAHAGPEQIASLFGLSETQALVVIFVLLPFAVAAVVVPFVSWRWRNVPKPVLTSDILAHGEPGEAEILSIRNMGTIVDLRPMVRFELQVRARPGEGSFRLEVVQALPRQVIGGFRVGDVVEIRLTPDHSAGAIVWGGPQRQ